MKTQTTNTCTNTGGLLQWDGRTGRRGQAGDGPWFARHSTSRMGKDEWLLLSPTFFSQSVSIAPSDLIRAKASTPTVKVGFIEFKRSGRIPFSIRDPNMPSDSVDGWSLHSKSAQIDDSVFPHKEETWD